MPRTLFPTDLEAQLQSWDNPPLFDGLSKDQPQTWLNTIQRRSQQKFIPDAQWSDVAIYFLRGDLQTVMLNIKENSATPQWEWQNFKSTLIEIWEASKKTIDNETSAKKIIVTSAGVILIGGGALLAVPGAALGALSLAGFSATGPVAGSLAAMTQSAVYGGATTGLFSACQSFAMTASVPAFSALAGVGYKMGHLGHEILKSLKDPSRPK